MKTWIKLTVLILGIVTISGVAATIRNVRKVERASEAARVPAKEASGTAAPASRPSTTAAEPDDHILRLVKSTDSDFDSLLDSEYPDLRTTPGFDQVRSKVVIVQNQSLHAVHAFVMKWTVQEAGGSPQVIFTPYMKTPTPDHVLTGGRVLGGNEITVLSPWFALSKSQFRGGQGKNRSAHAFLNANARGAAKDNTLVNSSIDSVVFGDRRIVGADEAKMLDHFECERNGQHDEGVSIVRAIKDGATDQQINDKLNAHIQKGRSMSGGTDRESLYFSARGSEAQMLLQVFKQGGKDKLEKTANKVMNFRQTRLVP